jgi:hypothetical protein
MLSRSTRCWEGLYTSKGERICGERRNCLYDRSYFWCLSALFISQTRRRRDRLDNTSVTCVCICVFGLTLWQPYLHTLGMCSTPSTHIWRTRALLCNYLENCELYKVLRAECVFAVFCAAFITRRFYSDKIFGPVTYDPVKVECAWKILIWLRVRRLFLFYDISQSWNSLQLLSYAAVWNVLGFLYRLSCRGEVWDRYPVASVVVLSGPSRPKEYTG